ncbi:MAG: ribose-5-phosphate isomerase RpiA [Ignavibacteriae bacterium]|nr:ribose-5-phosphate isomerase RpiA [Ignavibacteriota bacterium]
MTQSEKLKKEAAHKAVEEIKSGMVVGLGTGSTVFYALHKIAELLKSGELKNIVGIPSSKHTEKIANEIKIPLTTFEEHQTIDVTIDGADEVDKYFNLIKGGGGAFLREKILAQASKRLVIIVDESKLSPKLGDRWSVPIEVIKFSYKLEEEFIKTIPGKPILRMFDNGEPVITDEGNFIIDANFGRLQNPFELAEKLENRAGIVEHGLFLHLTNKIIVAGKDEIKVLEKK